MALLPAAAVVSARRAGTTAAFEQFNKYFTIQEMPVVSSRYWNMAYMLRCQEAARNAGVMLPEQETPVFTNFVC